ncbi:MAG: redoxin domain-containing protein, partial [Dehalococcoidia bacterium]
MDAGDRAPDVTLEGPDGTLRLTDALRDGPLVLAFFQEANTPACDAEVRGFATEYDLVQELGGRVLAVSTDPLEEQQRFAASV